MDAEELKRELPFDLYGRYALARDIINKNREPGEACVVLDVGGRGNLMQMFLPGDEVFYLDPGVDPDDHDENFLEGDGCDIPRPEESFDYVISADVFEHVEPEKRKHFIEENLRVARKGVVLAAPFYSRNVELAEWYANESYRIISKGENHAWLKEHSRYGLPNESEVEDFLNQEGYEFQKIANNELGLWEYLICIYFVAREKPDQFRDLNLFYNETLYRYDHGEESYRKIYFIKKEDGLRDLDLGAEEISVRQHMEVVSKGFGVLAHIYARDKEDIKRLKMENTRLLRELNSMREQINQLQDRINDILNSRSWKAGKPLRDANALVQRLRNRDG